MANSRTARLVLAVVVAFVTTAVAATPSFAQACAPGAVGCVELDAGIACSDFALHVDFFGGDHSMFREFLDKNGNVVRALNAGQGFLLEFTNLSTGASLTTPANGSVLHVAYNSDGSSTQVATGNNVIILFPTDVPAGPSTTLYVGQVVYTVDLNNVFTIQTVSGTSTDICAALSG